MGGKSKMSHRNDRKEIVLKEKPKVCPNCGSKKIADILYGVIILNPRLEQKIAEGRFILGVALSAHRPRPKLAMCRLRSKDLQ